MPLSNGNPQSMVFSSQHHRILMNLLVPDTGIEPRWRTYFRGAAFSMPALIVLAFSSVYLLPKLETLWRDASMGASFSIASTAITSVNVAYLVTQHFMVIAITVIAAVVLLEWRSIRWPRYRKATVGVAAFLTNTAILIFITLMFMTALMAAPALLQIK
jgi:hypothetical protein